MIVPPPQTETELLERTNQLAGKSIGEVARQMNIPVPENLKRKKGWQGQFIETCLGADSGNLSQPDFSHLGIELKTLPIDYSGKVLESTYVCVLNLTGQSLLQWHDSPVFKKLNKVLWVPVAKAPGQSVIDYRIATPFLWQAPPQILAVLQQDWENAVELVSLGKVDQLNARQGEYLQVRPKAADSKALTHAVNREGKMIETLPRGFYLRSSFTQQILQQNLKLS
ncbi:DNA mismatch repair endonuclease MutH [Aliikangiella coralliicola]|uniref:DNA mismatch repair protein MutH n=1 Tax=Aliikangiella coralliicola TaxID=2592383 RepID=A0A545UGW8_9GAMM|nr:DNA mismatch repair endonuclease MutH [Aliikangiella coralliicola]